MQLIHDSKVLCLSNAMSVGIKDCDGPDGTEIWAHYGESRESLFIQQTEECVHTPARRAELMLDIARNMGSTETFVVDSELVLNGLSR